MKNKGQSKGLSKAERERRYTESRAAIREERKSPKAPPAKKVEVVRCTVCRKDTPSDAIEEHGRGKIKVCSECLRVGRFIARTDSMILDRLEKKADKRAQNFSLKENEALFG